MWWIGDGESVQVWGDNWLPGTNKTKILSPCWIGAENSKVSMFINQENCRWREDLLDHYLWQAIWKMNVLAKVKYFVWRACRDSLPTKTNLVKRRVIDDATCDCCKVQQEDVVHALYSCPKLLDLWNQCSQWKPSRLQQSLEFLRHHKVINKLHWLV